MPTPEMIVRSLALIANQGFLYAILWHVLLAAGIAAFAAGWRPARSLAGLLLSLPLLSVSLFAWIFHNPFNGSVFALFFTALALMGWRLGSTPVTISRGWLLAAGVVMIIFGWVYPHFLETGGWVRYLYAAPTGLVPCPTLSVLIGCTLALSGLNSRKWSLTLAGLGLFYGLFGTLRLQVRLDLGLILGAVALLVQASTLKSSQKQS